jgi:hypothetical protein
MSQAKAEDFPLLLNVFRDGLEYGVISKDEVVAWADQIVAAEVEPDYFFIELSRGKDDNELVEILNKVVHVSKNPIVQRVLLSIAYKKFIYDNSSKKKLQELCRRICFTYILTSFENELLYELDYYDELLFMADPNDFGGEKSRFLSQYGDFNLNNCDQWEKINLQIEVLLKEEEAKAYIRAIAYRKAREKRIKRTKLKLYTLMGGLTVVMLYIIIINYKTVPSNIFTSKFNRDLYQVSILYLVVFVPVFILSGVYWLRKRVKRVR